VNIGETINIYFAVSLIDKTREAEYCLTTQQCRVERKDSGSFGTPARVMSDFHSNPGFRGKVEMNMYEHGKRCGAAKLIDLFDDLHDLQKPKRKFF
jgi:hypothetical protein